MPEPGGGAGGPPNVLHKKVFYYLLCINEYDKIVHCVNREEKEKKEEASPNSIEQWHYQL